MAATFQEFVRNALGRIGGRIAQVEQDHAAIGAQMQLIEKLCSRPPSPTEEMDSIVGRRLFYSLTGVIAFTLADSGRRGQPISMLVSQDGPFIQTHYPLAIWRPSQPTTATNFGLWRPVSSWPLPAQAVPASAAFNLNEDIISLSYEMIDGGSQRNLQNLPVPPVLSRPDNLMPLPMPTLFEPNATVQFVPTYESIRFSDAVVPPTEGVLVVALPGYRIV